MMKKMAMKRILGCAVAAVLALSAASCGKSDAGTAQTTENTAAVSTGEEEESSTQLPNPWTEYDTLEEAEKAAGFSMDVPTLPDGYTDVVYRVMDGVLEVQARDADGNRLILRKGDRTKMGNEEKDISGDYNTYSEDVTKDVSGKQVEERGDAGLVSTAVWESDAWAYSVTSDAGLSEETMEDLVAQMA